MSDTDISSSSLSNNSAEPLPWDVVKILYDGMKEGFKDSMLGLSAR